MTATELALVHADQLYCGDLASVNDSVCRRAQRKASLNCCLGECIAVFSPTVEVAVLLVRTID